MYVVIHFSNVSIEAEDWLSSYVFEQGALGMSEQLQYEPKPGTDEVRSIISENRDLEVYFEEHPPSLFFEEIKSRFPEISFSVQSKENEDWMEGWKKHFKAFELVDGYWVVPSWLEAPKEAKRILKIDPGMAFGTGTHETTSMMAKALHRVWLEEPGESLVDVGTGTGILATLADFFGYKKIYATDTDIEAQRVSKENFEINNVNVSIDERQIDQIDGSFDVVLANIIEGVLVLIKEDLFKKVNPQGRLLLSGILKDNEAQFKSEFTLPEGWSWLDRYEDGEWLCLVAGKSWH